MTKAKLFMAGGSQAVRLPAEFRFEGDEVDVRRDATTGDVVLSKPMASWEEYFDWVRTLELPSDVLEDRNQPQDDLRDPLTRRRHGRIPPRRRGRVAPDAGRAQSGDQLAPLTRERTRTRRIHPIALVPFTVSRAMSGSIRQARVKQERSNRPGRSRGC